MSNPFVITITFSFPIFTSLADSSLDIFKKAMIPSVMLFLLT